MEKQNQTKPNPPRGPMGGPPGRGGPGSIHGERPKDFSGAMKKMLRYMKQNLPAIILAFLFAIGSVILTLNVPNVLGSATDELILGVTRRSVYDQLAQAPDFEAVQKHFSTIGEFAEAMKQTAPETAKVFEQIPEKYREEVYQTSLATRPEIDLAEIGRIILVLIVMIGGSVLISYMQGFIMSGVTQRLSYRFRKDINAKINKLPFSHFDRTNHGEVMSFITNDVDTISTTLNQSLSQILTSLVTLVGTLIMMLKISWLMTLAGLIIVPISLLVVSFVVKRSQKYFSRQQEYIGHVNGHIEEMYSGHTVVQLYNGEEKSLKKFQEYNDELYNSAWRSHFLSGLMHPIMMFIGNLGYVLVCVLGGFLTVNGSITVGNIQAFTQYLRQFNQPINQVASITNTLQSTAAAAERVFGFLDLPEEEETGTLMPQKLRGEVSFQNVRFGYQPDKIIIHNFSAVVKAGQRVAIVGPTGAGKTTVVKLLMRFYETNSGNITIDGVDIKSYLRSGLREQIGMVLQDTWLFGGSILENIRYGRLDATDEEVYAAAKMACADHFIKQLPGGYHFVINEEAGNISQGQKQLLTIARAILADPALLILDEATSSVDTRTEQLIQKAMDRLMEGRTSFIIAHRLSTIRGADMILVLKDGDIIEQGTHQELLRKDGFYATLYNSQFEGATE